MECGNGWYMTENDYSGNFIEYKVFGFCIDIELGVVLSQGVGINSNRFGWFDDNYQENGNRFTESIFFIKDKIIDLYE